jgi:hypothetical protein
MFKMVRYILLCGDIMNGRCDRSFLLDIRAVYLGLGFYSDSLVKFIIQYYSSLHTITQQFNGGVISGIFS